MKTKLFAFITVFAACTMIPNGPLAQNTHSVDLEYSSLQELSLAAALHSGIALTSDFTIECWIKLESFQTIQGIVKRASNSDGYILKKSGADLWISWHHSLGGTGSHCRVTDYFETSDIGNWIHVAVTVPVATPSSVAIYKNGIQQIVTLVAATVTSLGAVSVPFYIGSNGGTEFFDGMIDEVRIWSDVRTDNEIFDNMCVELAGNEANLVGYWKLNNSFNDSSPNGNDLTNSNATFFATDVACCPSLSHPGSLSGNGTVCSGTSTTYSGNTVQGADYYTWTYTGSASPNPNTQTTTTSSITFSPHGSGTLTMVAHNNCGESSPSSNSFPIQVNQTPNVSIAPSSGATICSGGNGVILYATPGVSSYSWSPTDGLNLTTGAQVTANPTSTTTYTVTASNGNCTDTDQYTVNVSNLQATVTANPPSTNSPGEPIQLSASGGNECHWTQGQVSDPNQCTPTASPSITTDYCVTITDMHGCQDQDCINVPVASTICNSSTVTLIPNSGLIPADGGTGSFYVEFTSSGPGCTWSVIPDCEFITGFSPSSTNIWRTCDI